MFEVKKQDKNTDCKKAYCSTIVIKSSHILDLQGPFSPGVLIPGVGSHERPVVEAFGWVILRPEDKRREEEKEDLYVCASLSEMCQ